ncbi:MAG: 2,3-diphosphoglycerate-dependent phosphoglycerate mutase [Muribaculaceae bacterium]|nr:2,3-diphosphoglycerate-dependent phosphoglycerate mutase [Muribaculaceae bacterium]
MMKLILLRHGQSEWNLENRFTGWTDVDLSDKGRQEAAAAGRLLLEQKILPAYCFTSYLKRAIHTMQIALAAMDRDWLPVVKDWHLNERHYGALQGLNKADTAAKYGDEQVHIWRRSYDVTPPALDRDDKRHPRFDPRYAALTEDELPATESLQTTIARVRSCWEELIAPALRHYGDVMVTAHGNSLRGLAMMLKHLTPEEVVTLEIPTGRPWIFELDSRLTPVKDYFLEP